MSVKYKFQILGANPYSVYLPGSYNNTPIKWWQLKYLAPRNCKVSNNNEDAFVTVLLVYYPKKIKLKS